MKKSIILLLMFFVSGSVLSSQHKEIKKNFPVDPAKKIEVNTTGGMDVDVKTWDKNEIAFNLRLKVECSDNDFEKEYAAKFDIEKWETSSEFIIDFIEADDDDEGWSFWDIFQFKFNYHFSREVRGEIFIPKSNALELNIRYSKINLEDNPNLIDIIGRGNTIKLRNCSQINKIENPYGNLLMKDCNGNLELETRSSDIIIDGFGNSISIDAPYANLDIAGIKGDLKVDTRSAITKIKNVDGDIKISSDYSEVSIENVNGIIYAEHRSNDFSVLKAEGLVFDGPYSNLNVENIKSKTNIPVRIKDRSAKIQMKNIESDLIIEDSYSTIQLLDIKGNVQLAGRSAPIEVKNLKGNWKSESKYSEIKMENIECDSLVVENQSEPVNIQFKNNPLLAFIKNDYGGVTVSLKKNFDGELELKSLYGGIESELPLKMNSNSGQEHKAYGLIGSGKSKIKIENRSAEIKIKAQ